MNNERCFYLEDAGNTGWLTVAVRGQRYEVLEEPTHSGGGSSEELFVGRVLEDTRRHHPLRVGTPVRVSDYSYGVSIRQARVHVIPRRRRTEQGRRQRRPQHRPRQHS